jgi:hypothetical protein
MRLNSLYINQFFCKNDRPNPKRSKRTIMKVTNKMQLYKLIYFSLSALHVSGDAFAHHPEQMTIVTVSGSIHPSSCRLVSWMS